MKTIFWASALLIMLIFAGEASAGTCTSISRTNFSANTILTSTELNSQFNTSYNNQNALDGGCITDGTVELAALGTSEFGPMLNGIKQGCSVAYSSASAVNIQKCIMSVNGSFLTTTANTSVSMGCTGCSSETASTSYYVYVKSDSSGSTLNPLILTGAPNADGYDASGNRAVGRIYNNGSSDVATSEIFQWDSSQFVKGEVDKTVYLKDVKATTVLGGGLSSGTWYKRDLATIEGDSSIVTVASSVFTLQAGKYLVEAQAEGYAVNSHQIRIQNTSVASTAIIGVSSFAAAAGAAQTTATASGIIEISAAQNFELQHRCATTEGTSGRGNANSFGLDEVYAIIKITKLR